MALPQHVPASDRRAGWRLLGDTVKPMKKTVLAGTLFGLTWTAAKVSVPSLTRAAIDKGIEADDTDALLRWSLAILAVGVVAAVCIGLRRYNAFKIAYTVEARLRRRLFAHLQRLHFAFHDEAQTGQLMARAATDLQQINSLVVMIPLTVANIVTVTAATVLLLLIHPLLAALALGALPLINLELQGELAEVATVVEETITGVRVVKGFGAEETMANRMRARAARVLDQAMKVARVRASFNPFLDFLPAVGLIVVLWYGGSLVLRDELTVGELVAFNAYLVMMIAPLRMTGMIVAQAQRAVAASSRVHAVLVTAPAIVEREGSKPLPPGGGALHFEDVSFGYGGPESRRVLDGFTLTVEAGEAVALVGPTGTGKSTVARLLPRFYDVDSGSVQIDAVDVRDVQLTDLRQNIGFVFEDTFLFSDTIRGNIAFADPHASQERVDEAARLAGATEFISRLPEGYDTLLGERGFSLSGGQRQRIALARAILADPRVLILDDATSAVDPTKEHEIRDALATVMQGRTTLVIAHRPATIALADRVVLLDEGRVIAEGTHDELLATSARYREVLAQASEEESDEEEVAVS
jgi:ATP-binding cassette subfamily B protein